jgi:hypothetical protein
MQAIILLHALLDTHRRQALPRPLAAILNM